MKKKQGKAPSSEREQPGATAGERLVHHPHRGLTVRALLRVLPAMVRGHWHYIWALFGILLLTSILEGVGFSLVIPLLQTLMAPAEQVAQSGTLQKSLHALTSWIDPEWRLPGLLAILIIVFMSKSAGLVVSSALVRWFINTLRMNWVSKVLLSFARAPYSKVMARPSGEVVENMLRETDLASRAVLLLVEFGARTIQITVLIGVLLLTNWRATLLVLALGIVVAVLSSRAARNFSLDAGKMRQTIRWRANDIVTECVDGLRTIKLLDIAAVRAKRLRDMLREFRRIDTNFELIAGLPTNMIDLVGVVVGSAIILFMTMGLGLRMEEALPVTALFGLVFLRLAAAAGHLFSRRLSISSSLPSMAAVHELMTIEPEQLPGSVPFPGFVGDIVFENIVLQPPGRPQVFDGLNMRIAPVGLTAIVGPSGSGKTTLVDLIVRLREPDAGRVLVNGRDIREFDVRSLRRRVGYLSQDPQLFNGTVAENLRLGRPEASDAEMVEAARRAHVLDFVSAMPHGFDTPLGRSGITLSGGQRQRLALARELLRSPDLYIFDEPTSALDQEAEAVIGELVNDLSRSHPVVIISHRQDVIQGANVIYRIEQGQAVELAMVGMARESTGSA